tara:strand:+ start:568 stop:1095 length:528 start_codon:yes stop_codon:yes gene_type:complete
MKVVDVAEETYRELGEPSTISVPAIATWLRNNIGGLNNSINTEFEINATSLEIERKVNSNMVNITEYETFIFKKMYAVHYYEILIRQSAGAASTDTVMEVSQDGMRVRKANKLNIMKELASVKKQESEDLFRAINFYKTNKAQPRQVAGDDTIEGFYDPYYRGAGTDFYNRVRNY